jgi:uroporphyrinogen-III decarboxylase
LGANLIDTGFPIDLGRLRRDVGPDVQIMGGLEVSTLLHGSPQRIRQRSRELLESGVKHGGKFIFKEANNFPPCVPIDNVRAMYQACLDFGGY